MFRYIDSVAEIAVSRMRDSLSSILQRKQSTS